MNVAQDPSKYPSKTAGNLMTTDIPIVPPDATLQEIRQLLDEMASEFATLNYIYILDKGRLQGIISIKDLFRKDPNTKAHSIMKKDPVTTHPYTHIEKVVKLAIENNIKAVPIQNKEHKFLGVITNDLILRATLSEITEDWYKFAGLFGVGTSGDDIMKMTIWKSLSHRLPWIILGLAGGIGISQLIGLFETTLKETLILASFIPLMVYMSSAVAQQIAAFLIRDTATRGNIKMGKYFTKHFYSVIVISLLMGILLGLYGGLIHSVTFGIVLALSMSGAVLSSIITGFIVPIVFIKLKADPANATGPIGSVISDFLSVIIYLLIASALL